MMKVESLFSDMKYLGLVESRKQSYYVFEGPDHYVSASFQSRSSGYFTVVDRDAVAFFDNRFAGKTVTRKTLQQQPQASKYIHNGFEVFHILYVLVALRRARINRVLSKGHHALLHFDIKPKPKTRRRGSVRRR